MIYLTPTCCNECGKRYSQTGADGRGCTTTQGECDVCGEETWISPQYDYGGLRDEWRSHRDGIQKERGL